MKTEVYKSGRLSGHPVLAVILHGDSPGGPTSYQYAFARKAAEKMDNLVAAALLRPGYRDDTGDQSEGRRGLANGDNYTPEVVDTVAGAVGELRSKFRPSATVVIGHSGGAAITADLIGRSPSGIGAALLVSCPCDLPTWRKHMVSAQFRVVGPFSLVFLLPVRSLSPIALASYVPNTMRVRLVVGSRDPNTLPKFSEEYADAVRKHGVDVSVTVAPGLEHNILLEPVVFEELKRLVAVVGAGAPR
jgi:pimeloyl-ACP methyl ester carboxylesterase